MYEAVIAGAFTLAGIGMTKLVDLIRDRAQRKSEQKKLEAEREKQRTQLEADASGEWSRALLVDQAKFRVDLIAEVGMLRDELKGHDGRCDEKIAKAIEKSERHCDEKIARKLRSQAAQLRYEFNAKLAESSEASS